MAGAGSVAGSVGGTVVTGGSVSVGSGTVVGTVVGSVEGTVVAPVGSVTGRVGVEELAAGWAAQPAKLHRIQRASSRAVTSFVVFMENISLSIGENIIARRFLPVKQAGTVGSCNWGGSAV